MTSNLGLDHLGVEVTHGDHGHQVRPVPALVKLLQAIYRRGFYDIGKAYWGPFGVARRPVEQRVKIILQARVEALSSAPLFQNHAALQLHLVMLEGHSVGPVAENLKCGLDNFGIVSRNLQPVSGVIVAGLRVQVATEGAADGFEVFDDLLLGKALRAIERHVFYEMRQPTLIVLFQDRADLHHQ